MNATKPGLYDAGGMMTGPETADALRDAGVLANQAAGIALVCSLALDALADEGDRSARISEEVAETASRLMFKCWGDLTAAMSLLA